MEVGTETDIRRGLRGNPILNVEEDLIRRDHTEVEAEIETVDEVRGGRGNPKLNEVLPTRAGRWRRVS